jgi:hypothetical protein
MSYPSLFDPPERGILPPGYHGSHTS